MFTIPGRPIFKGLPVYPIPHHSVNRGSELYPVRIPLWSLYASVLSLFVYGVELQKCGTHPKFKQKTTLRSLLTGCVGTTEACGQGCGLQIPCVHSVMRSRLGKQEDTWRLTRNIIVNTRRQWTWVMYKDRPHWGAASVVDRDSRWSKRKIQNKESMSQQGIPTTWTQGLAESSVELPN